MKLHKYVRAVVVTIVGAAVAIMSTTVPAHASDWSKEALHCITVGAADPGSCGTVVKITRVQTRSDPTPGQLYGSFAPSGETLWITSGGMFNFRFRFHIQGEATTDWKTFSAGQVCARWGGGFTNDGCQQLSGRDIDEGKQVILEQCLYDTDRSAWVCHSGTAVA